MEYIIVELEETQEEERGGRWMNWNRRRRRERGRRKMSQGQAGGTPVTRAGHRCVGGGNILQKDARTHEAALIRRIGTE